MDTKYYTIAILFIIATATTFSKCQKGGLGCARTVYNFQMEIQAYPDNSSIKIDDTLWLEINAPTSLPDITKGKTVDYSGSKNLGTAIGFGQFFGKDSIKDAANLFEYKLINGREVNNPFTTKIREYLFDEQNGRYIFKLGIIPKEKGIFGIGFSNAANVFRKTDNCTKANFEMDFANTVQHFYLNPNINSSNTDTTRPSASYFFKVD